MLKTIYTFVHAVLCLPGKLFLSATKFLGKSSQLYFLLFVIANLFAIYSTDHYVSVILAASTLWLCFAISLLNHLLHQEKNDFIEGFITKKESNFLKYANNLTPQFLFFVNIILVCSIIFLLWKLSIHNQSFFDSHSSRIKDWSIYTVDLIFKAVLFDIPEVYNINLTDIQHRGFIGSTIVLFMRLTVLVLVVGSIMHWLELRKTILSCLQILKVYPKIGRTKLLLVLDVYPRQLKYIISLAENHSLQEKVRCHLWEILGESSSLEILPRVENQLQLPRSEEIYLSCLKAMEYLKTGKIEVVEPFLKGSDALIRQSCCTLASWNTEESIHILKSLLNDEKEDIRCYAIESLAKTNFEIAGDILVNIVYSADRSKEERFAAKDSIIALQKLSATTKSDIENMLMHSDSQANRRFSAMILGSIENLEHAVPLAKCLEQDQDENTRFYCILGLHQLGKLAIDKRTVNHEVWNYALQQVLEKACHETYEIARAEAIHCLGSLVAMVDIDSELGSLFVDVSYLMLEWRKSDSAHILDAISTTFRKMQKFSDVINDMIVEETDIDHGSMGTSVIAPVYYQEKRNIFQEEDFTEEINDLEEMAYSVECTEFYQEQRDVFQENESNEDPFEKFDIDAEDLEELERLSSRNGRFVSKVECKKTNKKYIHKYSDNISKHSSIRKEIAILRSIDHPSIVKIEAISNVGYLMPLQGTITLAAKLEQGFFPVNHFFRVMKEICETVSYLHQNSIIYCDLKPENILYFEDRIVLFDFGGAHYRDFDYKPEGTPPFMAPELIFGHQPTKQVDIYSLGILAYQILTGERPGGIAWPVSGSCAPPDLAVVLAQATAFYPKDRYLSVQDFWNSLKQLEQQFKVVK